MLVKIIDLIFISYEQVVNLSVEPLPHLQDGEKKKYVVILIIK